MKSIWGRQNKPKLKLEINEDGQPCGKSATRFANFVGTQIRTKGFPVEFDDWRKVDLSKKLALWTEAKVILGCCCYIVIGCCYVAILLLVAAMLLYCLGVAAMLLYCYWLLLCCYIV